MGKVILIGGGKLLGKKFKWLLEEIPKKSSILIIPAFSKNDEKWEMILKAFFEKADPKKIEHITIEDYRIGKLKHKINASDIVIIPGGKPDILLANLLRYKGDLKDWLRGRTHTYIGISAGALAACSKCIITKDEEYPKTKVIKGLGLVNKLVEVHYTEQVKEELKNLNLNKIVGIPEYAALIIDDENERSIGNLEQI